MRYSDSARGDGEDQRRFGRHSKHAEGRDGATDVASRDVDSTESQEPAGKHPEWTPPTMPPIKASIDPPTAIQRAVAASTHADAAGEVIDVRDGAIYPDGNAPQGEVISHFGSSQHFFDSDIHAPSVDDFFGSPDAKKTPGRISPTGDGSSADQTPARVARHRSSGLAASTPEHDNLPTPKNAPTGATADQLTVGPASDIADSPRPTLRKRTSKVTPADRRQHPSRRRESPTTSQDSANTAENTVVGTTSATTPRRRQVTPVPSPLDTQMITTAATPSWRRPARAIVAPPEKPVLDPALAKPDIDPETSNLQIVAGVGSKGRSTPHSGLTTGAPAAGAGATLTHTEAYLEETAAKTGESDAASASSAPAHAEPEPLSALDVKRARPRQATDLAHSGPEHSTATHAPSAQAGATVPSNAPAVHHSEQNPSAADRDSATRRRGRSSRWGFGAGKSKPSTGQGTAIQADAPQLPIVALNNTHDATRQPTPVAVDSPPPSLSANPSAPTSASTAASSLGSHVSSVADGVAATSKHGQPSPEQHSFADGEQHAKTLPWATAPEATETSVAAAPQADDNTHTKHATPEVEKADQLPRLWSEENKAVPTEVTTKGISKAGENVGKVAMVALVGAIAGFAYATLTPPNFEASDAILVRPHMNTSEVIANTGVVLPAENAESDIDAAMEILRSEQAEEAVLKQLTGDADVDALRQHVTIEPVEGLPMIRVTADGKSAKNARDLVTVYVDSALGLHDQAVKAGAQNALSAKPSMPADEREQLQQIIETGDVGIVPARGTNVGAVEVRDHALPISIGAGLGALLGLALVLFAPRRTAKI